MGMVVTADAYKVLKILKELIGPERLEAVELGARKAARTENGVVTVDHLMESVEELRTSGAVRGDPART